MDPNVTIKAIESTTIHQIQAGQVIVDLCSVAKELVENAVDAGATTIDVRFKNQGLDSIEIQDNGSGIAAHNYESIALKHYTSKLSTYDDLSTLETFGFRGEALSSLCALSKLTVVTCTKNDAPKATKIEFEVSGKLKDTTVVSGQKGTTVTVENLFRNLPVRRRELERNIKREWGKVISLLNQYACIQTGIKFTVSQQPNKGKRMILFSTKGNPSTRENIINVFGVKTMNALVMMDLKLELVPSALPLHLQGKAKGDSKTTEVRVVGYVSKPVQGEGRQAPDRQMFYVNGRPCGLPQFAKVFNEAYRSYNSSQSPFIFADIQLDTHLYDVNVSPDKRTILLHDQGQMLDNLRESLIDLFEKQDVTIPVSQAPGLRQAPLKTPAVGRSHTPASTVAGSSRGPTAGPSSPIRRREPSPVMEDEAEDEPRLEGEKYVGGGREQDPEDEEGEEEEEHIRPQSIARSASVNSEGSGMLSRWLGQKSGSRPVPNTSTHSQTKKQQTTKRRPAPASPRLAGQAQTGARSDEDEDMENFYAHATPVQRNSSSRADEIQEEDVYDDMSETGEPQPQPRIPAIPPPSQPYSSRPTSAAYSRPFQRSTQPTVATITIGHDHTTTSLIGNPSKRPRVSSFSSPDRSSSLPSRSKKRTMPVPSFGGRLTQMFAAAAARNQQNQSRELEITHEEIDAEDMDIDDEEAASERAPSDEEDEEEALFVTQPRRHDKEELELEDSNSQAQDFSDGDDGPPEPEDDGRESPADAEHQSDCCDEEKGDGEYIDEEEKKAQEDKKVQDMITAAEAAPVETSEEVQKRAQVLLKGRTKRKDMTINLIQRIRTSTGEIQQRIETLESYEPSYYRRETSKNGSQDDSLEAEDAEEKLSLKISKTDFANMKIIGQFNLGFILAVRPQEEEDDNELFIIDQHASDEKYNFERLQAVTTVQSQRLVQPKTLDLTAVEEEIILEHLPQLEKNGFIIKVDTSGDSPVGSRCQLLSLPLSRETTFDLADLEELIFLLGDNPTSNATTVPRPSKVRKMFAMRACRSSIMIGRALSHKQMEKVVRHMGEMEKPWNCPHGRPTMRHLCGLGATWAGKTWEEGDGFEGNQGEKFDYRQWAREVSGSSREPSSGEEEGEDLE
ncbi:mismatch repair endonuclease PMS2 [Podospora australis]|uniref:DNA mismatch repair protein PMS1 n=1 Tax=Podospora australis TaxID=1536484 RepID=A0AAN6X415_9PEZI|nr:mismatch repair endonuclease PMS2 [Podospora australis]